MSEHSILLMGAGYVGTAILCELKARGKSCHAMVASKRSEQRLNDLGFSSHRVDLDGSDTLELPKARQVIYLVPPRKTAETDERLALFLKELPASVDSILYVSTSGVYGDRNGELTDENSVAAPHSARAYRRLDAETKIQAHCKKNRISWLIARVPGIYGPGRLPLRSLEEGRPIIRVSESNPGNRIHRDDLAAALVDLLEHMTGRSEPVVAGDDSTKHFGEIFNLGDNNHLSGSEFTLAVAHLAGLPEPPQISREEMKATASSTRWSFMAESRRLDSRKLLGVLSAPLRYADPIDGIKASLEAPDDPAA